ncbi:FtsW/RodA/SpoVE family cell cycle protein [Patescibacteria group bacterium]|nr:FtsW/RodA/SpoVE family cell cycle protein [Patescibacteria group bacterium]
MKKSDSVFLTTIFLLLIFGLFALASSGAFVSCGKTDDCYFYLKHQIIFGLIPGLFFFGFFSFLNYKFLKKIAPILFIISIALLVSVFIDGIGEPRNKVARWISIFGITFQPSEFVKLFLLISMSAFLAKRDKYIKSFKKVFIPLLSCLAIISFLIVKQPDIGTLLIILSSIIVIYFVAGGRIIFLALTGIGIIPVVLLVSPKIQYVIQRISVYFGRATDVSDQAYHVKQAVLAISSGGFWGKGIGHASSKFAYLPEVMSDSIFAVMAEELGFLLISLLVFIYLFIVYRIFYISSLSKDRFAFLLLVGIGSLFIFQTFVNMGAMLGLIPLTGTPLPLVGYGGTNMVVFLMAFGIVANISRHIKT